MSRDTQAEGEIARCEQTLDLFGDFGVPEKKPIKIEQGGKPLVKLKVDNELTNMIDISKPEPKIISKEVDFSTDFDPTESIALPKIPKRDLTMDDLGWQREFIPHLNDFAYLSNSRIKKILESMAHFEWSYVRKIRSEETDAKRLGKIVHNAILEPDLFKSNHVILPVFSGKGSKAAKAEFLGGLPPEAIIMTEKEVDKILYMIDSVLNHPTASQILKGATFEVNGYTWDERHQMYWLIKPDILKTTLLGDLKTSKSAEPDSFLNDVFKYKYFIQAPIYLDQASNLLGKKLTQFPFVVIENTAPHICEVYKLADHLVETGRQLVDMAVNSYKFHMDAWKKADEKGQRYFWPGYTGSPGIKELHLKLWQQNKLESIELAHIG